MDAFPTELEEEEKKKKEARLSRCLSFRFIQYHWRSAQEANALI